MITYQTDLTKLKHIVHERSSIKTSPINGDLTYLTSMTNLYIERLINRLLVYIYSVSNMVVRLTTLVVNKVRFGDPDANFPSCVRASHIFALAKSFVTEFVTKLKVLFYNYFFVTEFIAETSFEKSVGSRTYNPVLFKERGLFPLPLIQIFPQGSSLKDRAQGGVPPRFKAECYSNGYFAVTPFQKLKIMYVEFLKFNPLREVFYVFSHHT